MKDDAPLVLVAHDAEVLRETMGFLLREAGLRARTVADGHAALDALGQAPAVLVLDVAISGVLVFELIERIQEYQLKTRTLLVASVYNRTSYKRRPTSLYGADDYVEQHHIPDSLVPKVHRLLGIPDPAGVGAGSAAEVERTLERRVAATVHDAAPGSPLAVQSDVIRAAGESRLHIRYESVDDGRSRARRLARLIVADIALYNGDALAHADRTDLDARLQRDLDEGRELFALRVPDELREGTDFVGEALTEWLGHRGPG